MKTPLFIKYKTENNYYIYDVGTGKIIKANKTAYELIDDYHMLSTDELKEKYKHLGCKNVGQAIVDIELLRKKGCFADHTPRNISHVDCIDFLVKTWKPVKFLNNHHTELVLGITEECNLRCKYCIYGKHYPSQRPHRPQKMFREIAQLAIKEFLEHSLDNCIIGFYGGEPLLEFDLIRHAVSFAEPMAEKLGKYLSWTITTNGTLLSPEKLKFLCDHKFLIVVSIDGPKEIHDRYRIFKKQASGNQDVGSFDTIMRNIQYFVRAYPDYESRGIILTISPPFDIKAQREFFMEWYTSFPRSMVSLVNTTKGKTFYKWAYRTTQTGCDSLHCPELSPSDINGFRNVVANDNDKIHQARDEYKCSVIKNGYTKTIESPETRVLHDLFGVMYYKIHVRSTSDRRPPFLISASCIPGYTRLFCDGQGNYYPCEKVENVALFRLGNVFDGFDGDKAVSLWELWRNTVDCGNCVAARICPHCMAMWLPQEGVIDDKHVMKVCMSIITRAKSYLASYTEIMEKNPDAFMGTVAPEEIYTMPILRTSQEETHVKMKH